jgi:uncharacterized damage-inducible protein DinB
VDARTDATYQVHTAGERAQLDAFLDTYRTLLDASLDDLTEEEARTRLVPSKTTLLGLLKHVIYVEQIWFVETVTGTPRADLGLPPTVDESYDLDDSDTIESLRQAHREVCERARQQAASLALDDLLTGHPRIPEVTLRWMYLHMIRELAQHLGHAEILREQLLARR